MMNFRHTLVSLALAACLAATGCGGDDEGAGIPANSAAALEGQLDSIQSRFENGGGACADIAGGDDPNTEAVQDTIDSLPDDVDPDVRDALEQSFDRLFELAEEQCDAQTETTPAPTEPEPVPVPEAPPETDTTETTEPPPTETTEPPPATEPEPPTTDEGGDGGVPPAEGGDGSGGTGGSGSSGTGGSGGVLVPEEDENG